MTENCYCRETHCPSISQLCDPTVVGSSHFVYTLRGQCVITHESWTPVLFKCPGERRATMRPRRTCPRFPCHCLSSTGSVVVRRFELLSVPSPGSTVMIILVL